MSEEKHASAAQPKIHVACASDETYMPHCASMLFSLLQHNPSAVVHFLHGPTLDSGNLRQLHDFVNALGGDFVPHCIASDAVAGLPGMGRIPPLMWYRIYLPVLLNAIDKVLYLDCDIIVRGSLQELWNMVLEDCYVAAVENVMESRHASRARELGLETYFNSGVLLFNLAMLRHDGKAGEIVQYGREHQAELMWPDQDALNICLASGRKTLHPRWNFQSSLIYFPQAKLHFSSEELYEAENDPMIVHFEGGLVVKPWHRLSKHPYRDEYLECRAQTPWPLYRFDGDSWTNRLLRFLPEKCIWTALAHKHTLRSKIRSLTAR